MTKAKAIVILAVFAAVLIGGDLLLLYAVNLIH
jgi:hypothetical protein